MSIYFDVVSDGRTVASVTVRAVGGIPGLWAYEVKERRADGSGPPTYRGVFSSDAETPLLLAFSALGHWSSGSVPGD